MSRVLYTRTKTPNNPASFLVQKLFQLLFFFASMTSPFRRHLLAILSVADDHILAIEAYFPSTTFFFHNACDQLVVLVAFPAEANLPCDRHLQRLHQLAERTRDPQGTRHHAYARAAILVVWGVFVIGTIDNFLSPRLVGHRASLHELLIFFAVLGGLEVFGVLGLVIGPVIVAITLALIEMVRQAYRLPTVPEPLSPSVPGPSVRVPPTEVRQSGDKEA